MNTDGECIYQTNDTKTNACSEDKNIKNEVEIVSFATFLESHPPSKREFVSNLVEDTSHHGVTERVLSTPDLDLVCDNEKCKGVRVFRAPTSSDSPGIYPTNYYIRYTCSNCGKTKKTFSLEVKIHLKSNRSLNGYAYKFGESPPFGPSISSKLISLIRPDRDMLFKGRNCESQGLGIGAFAYYRRIVERQKNGILDEIIRVAKKLSTDEEAIESLEFAKKEKQFSKAVGLVKEAIPSTLLINGHNPLTLLHNALSEGLHSRSDNECLNVARDIRIVLAELAERLRQALKDEAELNAAVARLTKRKSVQ